MSPLSPWRNFNGQPDILRDKMWWYFCMPHGVWFCRGRLVVLFNKARRPIIEFDPVEGLRRPASCRLFDRPWDEWDGPTREDMPDDDKPEPMPYRVMSQRTFYTNYNGPWLPGPAGGKTRVKITLIICDFMDGKMPSRGGK